MEEVKAGIELEQVDTDDTVIVIPSARPAPIRTLQSYEITHPTIIVSDPDHYEQHFEFYKNEKHIMVHKGKKGLIPQVMELYRIAHYQEFSYFFRLDDDLLPNTFVDVDRHVPTAMEALWFARQCIHHTRTTLAGFANTSRTDWLDSQYRYRRSAGLISGCVQICKASPNPEQFVNPDLPRYEDVYRSASHRRHSGAVGVAGWIGLDKRAPMKGSVAPKSNEITLKAQEIILKEFPDMVTCNGTRTLDAGQQIIPNWKMIGRPTP